MPKLYGGECGGCELLRTMRAADVGDGGELVAYPQMGEEREKDDEDEAVDAGPRSKIVFNLLALVFTGFCGYHLVKKISAELSTNLEAGAKGRPDLEIFGWIIAGLMLIVIYFCGRLLIKYLTKDLIKNWFKIKEERERESYDRLR